MAKISAEEYAERVRTIHGGRFVLLYDYRAMYKPIGALCQSCGQSFTVDACRLLNDSPCPYCGRAQMGYADFSKRLAVAGFSVREKDYKNANKQCEITCGNCGNWHWYLPRLIITSPPVCPHCIDK